MAATTVTSCTCFSHANLRKEGLPFAQVGGDSPSWQGRHGSRSTRLCVCSQEAEVQSTGTLLAFAFFILQPGAPTQRMAPPIFRLGQPPLNLFKRCSYHAPRGVSPG